MNTDEKGLRSKVIEEPVVLVAAHSKVGVVGQVDHVRRAHIDRVPQGVVGPTGTRQNGHGVASNV